MTPTQSARCGASASTKRRTSRAKAPSFGPDREEAGDRGRRALVGVRGPEVERHGRRLEGGADGQQADRDQRRRRQRAGSTSAGPISAMRVVPVRP